MERNYQFRERMMEVHRPHRRDKSIVKKDDQVEIDLEWVITIPREYDDVLMKACRDLEDYFFVSMDVSLQVAYEDEVIGKTIAYKIDEALPENSYKFTVTRESVTLCGHDTRAAAQAGYYLEDLMNLNEAPCLDIADEIRTPLYSPRMIHSGYGLDKFPEEHIRSIAHAGINALLIFVEDVDVTPHGYLDFNDLCYRAAQWGVDVYAYSYMKSRVYPEGPEAEEFYENLYGRLFERCPYFKGIIFVGESCEFPSKDPHTTGILRLDNLDGNGEPIVKGKPSPGWWPCYDFPLWLNMIKRIIRNKKPDADIVFWTYNWGYVEEKYRLELLRNIPTDVSLLVTFEMFEDVVRDGITNRTVDYTLFFEGPGKYFTSEAKLAKERGIRLYAMTNTGGLTWDVGTIPYEPAPYQWMRRYENMREMHENYGLCGTMDSHHYGFYPSFISDLAKWAFYKPTPDLNVMLRRIAVRDFSEETADDVLKAYEYFSDGIRYLISTNEDQYGPFRIGPSYPLILYRDVDAVFPSVPYAPHGGNEICNPVYKYDLSEPYLWDKINYEIKCHTKTAELYNAGCEILERVIPLISEKKRHEAMLLLNMCRFIRNAAKTTVNVKEWKKRKELLLDAAGDERNKIVSEMIEIGKRDIANAEETISLTQFDSRLGYEPSMEYMCDPEHLEWKINLTRRAVEEELPTYLV